MSRSTRSTSAGRSCAEMKIVGERLERMRQDRGTGELGFSFAVGGQFESGGPRSRVGGDEG